MHKLSENYRADTGLATQSITSATTVNGTGVDCIDTNDDCMAVLQLGAITGTGVSLDVKVQESDALASGYADITGAAFSTADENDDNKRAAIGFKRAKRYIRVVATTAGTITTVDLAVALLVKALHGASDLNSATPA